MTARLDAVFFVGVLLLVSGCAALVAMVFPNIRGLEMGVGGAFVAAGLIGALAFIRTQASASLPLAAGAIAVGLMTLTDAIAPGQVGDWAAVLLFVLLGISFLVLAAVPAPRWWPIIPAGVMLTLAGTVASGRDGEGGGVFLAGLGATFLVVYLMPPRPVRRLWALITAAVLVVLALPASGLSGQVLGIAVAIALIAGGILLLLRHGPPSTA